MHRFLQEVPSDAVLGRHEHELTLARDGRVATIVRAEPGQPIRAPRIDGVTPWRHFHWLTSLEAAAFELQGDHWLMAVREFVRGDALAALDHDGRPDPLDLTLRLSYRVRDLHETGLPHGDLQPGNVVIDTDGDVWLIDVALLETRPGDAGHVAGSAPLMAPELWEGAETSTASDIYALGCLAIWIIRGSWPRHADDLAGWARAHRDGGEVDLADLPTGLSGTLRRMLAPDPDERPSIQALIDVLVDGGATADVPPMVAGGLDTFDLDGLVDELDAGIRHVQLIGHRRSGRSSAARQLQARLTSRGYPVVMMLGQRGASYAVPPKPDAEEGPWSAVDALARQIGELSGVTLETMEPGRGDRLHAFERMTERILDLTGDEPLVIIWDDLDRVRPDTQAWWGHFVDAVGRRGCPISTVALSEPDLDLPAVRVELRAPGTPTWNRWRANTLRAEVRDLAQARWEQLATENGAIVGALLGALDREIGTRGVSRDEDRPTWDTATLLSMSAGWRDRVDGLLDECAFTEVVETCEALYRSLTARGRADAQTQYDLLRRWTDAVIGGGGHRLNDDLERALLDHVDDPRHAVLLARFYNALGQHADGLQALADLDADDEEAAELDSWRAQLALSSGRLDEVERYARQGLERLGDTESAVRAHLEVLQHSPAALRGEADAIEALAELAPELERTSAPHLLRARLHAYRAIGLTRTDDLDEATDAHVRALEQVEQGGLAAELPTYLLNAGTAYHRQGRLGLAREYYGRGLRIAQPTTRASTRALLFANQANVDLALGRLDEARELVRRGLDVARSDDLARIEVMCRSVLGDIELAAGDERRARRTYRDILEDERLDLTGHQTAEIQLALAETALQQRDIAEANDRLDDARRRIEEERLEDLEQYHGILRARLQWAEGGSLGTMAGIELFRRSVLAAEQAGNHRLVLRQSPHLISELQREGLDELLDEISETIQRSRNAIAMGLGRELRRDFFANLPDVSTPTPQSAADSAPPRREAKARPSSSTPSASVEPFYRMLSLNEVILHTEDLGEMLPDALEIAMGLSGAERGFILLRDDQSGRVGGYRVAASRDTDGAAIPSPHLEVSLTVAEEAARTGRTVVTLNAAEDRRFSEALSVVDLDLTSVLCVPIRDATGLLGALYLDHRFRPGIFEGEIPRMMEAFGHQLALGITNARRIDELQAERARLAETQQKLEELLAERESMLAGMERRVSELTDQVERQQMDVSLRESFPDIAYGSRAMEKVLGQVERVSRGDIPVVVTGESGVGKELIARAIHDASPRKTGPFVAFNCGAVSESLFESEMFGHVKGAFTGADIDRQGLFVAADGGTIFLDEIGEMPMSMQVKLLRVLQERQVRRVGDTKSRPIDVRIVAATNRDLAEMVGEEQFREDLYYRLAAFIIEIPPLRDRRDDIPLIATALLERISEQSGRTARLAPDGARLLSQCEWPGNVRELENTLRAAAVMADGEELGEAELAGLVRVRSAAGRPSTPTRNVETRGRRRKADRLDVVEALRRADDDREKAAEILGVSERTLYRYLKRWDLY